MTAFGSIFLQDMPAIPYGLVPDVRLAFLLGGGFTLGLYAAGGPSRRRTAALWSTLLLIVAFHLEEASISWIGLPPGSITGTRVGILGTAGSLLALLAILLLHVEVESVRLRHDLERRGARPEDADATSASLMRRGGARVLGLGAAIAALALLVLAMETLIGDNGPGEGTIVLLLGATILGALGFVLVRLVPKAATEAS